LTIQIRQNARGTSRTSQHRPAVNCYNERFQSWRLALISVSHGVGVLC
jgi:hypothetical protein